ncbi:MAG: DNA methyltransferase [Armatimonadota bacterium]|nr:DNA methyltransferase [Armatimonadota bacterium]
MTERARLRLPRDPAVVGTALPGSAPGQQPNGEANRLLPEDRPVHQWYRFVLSFPPHLVREYVQRFALGASHRVLDPFCGTGTTLVECKKLGIPSVGVEAHPMAHFASQVKVDWTPDPDGLVEHAAEVAEATLAQLSREGIHDDLFRSNSAISPKALRTLPPETARLLLANSISPLPLHKTLVLLDCLRRRADVRHRSHELLALARAAVFAVSNLHFGPEVGVGPPKADAMVVHSWLSAVHTMATDLRIVRRLPDVEAQVHMADSRKIARVVEPYSIDAVITSPPYPNEKDYTRTTRLESVLLGFIRDKAELRALKAGLVRSNTRNVFRVDDDDTWVAGHAEIDRIARRIETRRKHLGKTSGFERLYARVTKLYFGGMARHLAELRQVLRPGARLAYVVGDQASYLRVMIRTGRLLADIGHSLGYEVMGIDLFRTRLATVTREQLREEVVVLRWPGGKASLGG